MKSTPILSLLLLSGTLAFGQINSSLTQGTSSSVLTSRRNVGPHATAFIPNFSCQQENFDAVVSFFPEEGEGITWVTVSSELGSIAFSYELPINSINWSPLPSSTPLPDAKFYVRACTPYANGNVAITGSVFDPSNSETYMMTGILNPCTAPPAVGNGASLRITSTTNTEGIKILKDPSNSSINSFVSIGRKANNNGTYSLVIQRYNNFNINTYVHDINFKADDAVVSLTSNNHLIISGISTKTNGFNSNDCEYHLGDDRGLTLVEYDLNTNSILTVKSYTTAGLYKRDERIGVDPIELENIEFLLEVVSASGHDSYFGAFNIFETIEDRLVTAVAEFDPQLGLVQAVQINPYSESQFDMIEDANLHFMGTNTNGEDMVGLVARWTDYEADPSTPNRGVFTVGLDVANPWATKDGKITPHQTLSTNGNLMFNEFTSVQSPNYEIISQTSNYQGLLFTGSPLNGSIDHTHSTVNSIDQNFKNCTEKVHVQFYDLCMDEVLVNHGQSTTDVASVHTALTRFNQPYYGYGGLCNPYDGKRETEEGANAEANEIISIYPNPGIDQLTISMDGQGDAAIQITLTDMTGKTVIDETVSGPVMQIDASLLPSGSYLVRMLGTGVSHQQLWVKE